MIRSLIIYISFLISVFVFFAVACKEKKNDPPRNSNPINQTGPINPQPINGTATITYTYTNTAVQTATATNTILSPWDELLFPAKLTECQGKGRIYDRLLKDCLPAQLLQSGQGWCTISGLESKFSNVGTMLSQKINQLTSDGFELDQCGERVDDQGAIVSPNDPVALFIKKIPAELRIRQEKICYQGSTLCQ